MPSLTSGRSQAWSTPTPERNTQHGNFRNQRQLTGRERLQPSERRPACFKHRAFSLQCTFIFIQRADVDRIHHTMWVQAVIYVLLFISIQLPNICSCVSFLWLCFIRFIIAAHCGKYIEKLAVKLTPTTTARLWCAFIFFIQQLDGFSELSLILKGQSEFLLSCFSEVGISANTNKSLLELFGPGPTTLPSVMDECRLWCYLLFHLSVSVSPLHLWRLLTHRTDKK